MMTKDIEFLNWIKDNLPENKNVLSKDAVEILLSLVWELGKQAGVCQEKARLERIKYCDDY